MSLAKSLGMTFRLEVCLDFAGRFEVKALGELGLSLSGADRALGSGAICSVLCCDCLEHKKNEVGP